MESYADIMFGDTARAEQSRLGMRERFEKMYQNRLRGPIDADAQAFIETRDSFYLSSVTETGWPYVQHRGGPSGFLKVTGPEQIGFADYPGNQQLISKANMMTGGRVSLILMDFPRKGRLKIAGHARVSEAAADPDLSIRLGTEGSAAAERLVLIDVVAMDWNCPKYITPRFTEAEIQAMIAPRIQALAAENAALAARVAELEGRGET